mmetsp:Transcript_8086/g.23795  ORF Transcript_8086/g.23795 Transcript_8086/m.23795 type:complete len:690 (+) Transcript_8086:160-2229(+)
MAQSPQPVFTGRLNRFAPWQPRLGLRGAIHRSPVPSAGSLPLGGARRFGREVVGDARNALHLAGLEALHHLEERFQREVGTRGGGGAGHEVVGDEGADADGVGARDAEGAGEEDDGHLGQLAHEVVLSEALGDDVVGVLELLHRLLLERRGRHVVDETLHLLAEEEDDAVHRVRAARDHLGEVREALPVRGGEGQAAVVGLGADAHEVRVGAAVALHAHGAHGQEAAGKVLGESGHLAEGVELRLHHLAARGGVGLASAEQADGEARPGEGLPPHKLLRETQLRAERADLVLVVVLEGLDDAAQVTEVTHELRVVVVGLDALRVAADHLGGGLDEVGPQRALREEHVIRVDAERVAHLLRHAHEGVADDLALDLRGHHLVQRAFLLAVHFRVGLGEVHRRVQVVHLDADRLERAHHLLGLVEAHEAVVHVQGDDALGAQGLVEQGRAHRRVHAAGDEDEHLLGGAHGVVDLLDGNVLAVDHREGARELADAEEEVLEHGAAVRGQIDLRVELHAVEPAARVRDAHHEVARVRHLGKALGHGGHRVPVGEEHLRLVADALEEGAGHVELHGELAVFALGLLLNGAAKVVVKELHPVAHTQHGLAERKDARVVLGGALAVDGLGPAGDNERTELSELLGLGVQGKELAVHVELAHTAINHLAVLRASVQDGHLLHGVRLGDLSWLLAHDHV